ncbi:MAG: Spy/CpxP family protein refolding chaperone [Neisseria sp.]|nr:Spy/CpxP family protein refolding chaperone [Neisseria sp.]
MPTLSRRFLSAVALGSTLISPTAPAHALNIQDFQSNCDIRQLNLSQEQANHLRNIRNEYRQALDELMRDNRKIEHSRRGSLMKILAGERFDEKQAQRYVEERYAPGLRFAVNELDIQHRFYQLLSPEQRKIWQKNCVR